MNSIEEDYIEQEVTTSEDKKGIKDDFKKGTISEDYLDPKINTIFKDFSISATSKVIGYVQKQDK